MSRATAALLSAAAVLLVVAAAVLAAGGSSEAPSQGESGAGPTPDTEALPRPREPIPRDPDRLAVLLADDGTFRLNDAIDRWIAEGTSRGGPPREVSLLGLYQQRIYLLLGGRRRLARSVLARLPARVKPAARDVLAARGALQVLNPPTRRRRFTTGRALPAGRLLRLYRRAERRFGVQWELLAAVNFVETGFNKIRSNSTAGAQGPMQFIPSTWDAYGMGGNIRDPRDAIMGAANYLRASGAPGNVGRALFAYNPSSLYVTAVRRYARRIRLDRRAFYAFYSWQIFVRTPAGSRRLTGPRPL